MQELLCKCLLADISTKKLINAFLSALQNSIKESTFANILNQSHQNIIRTLLKYY